jgi:hypothetical protein
MAHRHMLQPQIEDKERLQKLVFVQKHAEGLPLKNEFVKELEKLEPIHLQDIDELVFVHLFGRPRSATVARCR